MLIAKESTTSSENEIINAILELQGQGKLKLEDQSVTRKKPANFATGEGLWYLLTISLGVLTSIFVFIVPSSLYPLVYLRNFLGLAFVLFLPGFAVTKALFKKSILGKETSKEIEIIARIALSVGLSVALVCIIGLLLFYSPWGLTLPAIVTTLFVLTAFSATAGLYKPSQTIEQE